jgi:UDP-N-acetylmuramoyl-L-alanyl-D-glutamate--2,6-diaminopimelate ligase
MRLARLLPALCPRSVDGPVDGDAHAVTRDSREAGPGVIFVAVPGAHHDGRQFAAGLRCAAVVAEGPAPVLPGVPLIQVADARRALATLAAALHGHPARRLPVVGVTGTNGKTTTTLLVESVLRAQGLTSLVVGTTGHRLAGQPLPAAHTTPEAPLLQGLLAEALRQGCAAALLEVSSIGLDLRRVDALPFQVAAWTSFSQDHLDHHGDMARYHAAKVRLFTELLAPDGVAILNDDDLAVGCVPVPGRAVLRFGTTPRADLQAADLRPGLGGTAFRARTPWGEVEARVPLLGRHNVENALCALGISLSLGLDLESAAAGLDGAGPVPGRLELAAPPAAGLPTVLVDYAHSPDALERVLATLRPLCRGRLWVVFGCGGDRDRAKRAPMGQIAARLADRVLLTSDNPRTEDPESILAEIRIGAGPDARSLVDRAEAIAAAVAEADADDLVLIAGKGHETTQTLGATIRPFDDRVEARAALAARRARSPA